MYITPPKLQVGDEIRVVAPSSSLSVIEEENILLAEQRLQELGFRVTYGRNAKEIDILQSSSIASRVEDLHEAFANPKVKGVFCVVGGYLANQLFRYLDYDLIRQNPKVLLGYSDITALSSAITAKTGLITYSGIHFSTFGMKYGFDYSLTSFRQCLQSIKPYSLTQAEQWSEDTWYRDQENRTYHSNPGWDVIQPGLAEGIIQGGNLCTFNLLHGTEFMPSLQDSILFLEDDAVSDPKTFDRDLQSILHQPGADQIRGILIGRFQTKFGMTNELLRHIISTKQELRGIPIIAGLDFGHTYPSFVFPIGGTCQVTATSKKVEIELTNH